MPSIIIITYLVALHVMLRLDCVIEVSHWGILCVEFNLFVFSLCWRVLRYCECLQFHATTPSLFSVKCQ